ncbi:restriction endonuclease subunit S, partial [Senegalimassilia anaerobia]|uniref:restriction endonuclease subunit S n=1 Tax=Senegalimassilia anaerobia TaxID=1473216 RepID=UPI003A97AC1D
MAKVKLGSVCTIVSGSTPKSSCPEYWGGSIKWVTPAEISDETHYIEDTERHITEEGMRSCHLRMMPLGTVLLSSHAPIGKTAITKSPMCCNQGFKNLICSNSISNEYLYHFLNAKTDELKSIGRGATFKEISKKQVESIAIDLPALDEQDRRITVLNQIENLLKRSHNSKNRIDDLVKSRFIEMFGDLGSILAIEDVCDVLSGFAFKSTRYVDEGIRIIRIANVQKGFIEDKAPCYYPITDQAAASTFALRKDDLLVSLTGNVGRVGIMTSDLLPAALNQRVACLRPKSDSIINMRYLFALLNLDEFENAAIESSSGSAQKNLSVKWLKSHRIAVPSIELQSAFADFFSQVDKLRF